MAHTKKRWNIANIWTQSVQRLYLILPTGAWAQLCAKLQSVSNFKKLSTLLLSSCWCRCCCFVCYSHQLSHSNAIFSRWISVQNLHKTEKRQSAQPTGLNSFEGVLIVGGRKCLHMKPKKEKHLFITNTANEIHFQRFCCCCWWSISFFFCF